MARATTKARKQHLMIRSLTLTQETNRVLQLLSQEASDTLGWTVSGSATVRALLQYASQQPASWAPSALFPIIEREIDAGVLWGRKKK